MKYEAPPKATKRLSISDIFNMISARGLTFGTILAIICNYILTNIGWNQDATFGGAFDNLNPDLAKTLLTAGAGIIGVLLDKMPEIREYLRALLSQSDVMPRGEIAERLDIVEAKIDEVKVDTQAIKSKQG